MGLSGAIPFISDAGSRVLAEAIQFRVFRAIARSVTRGAFEHALSLTTYLLPEFTRPGEPMLLWDWIRSMPGKRRRALICSERKLNERGEYARKIGEIKAFVKTEHMPYFGVKNGDYGVQHAEYVARLIQAPHDETHLIAGPYLKPLVERLKQVWHPDHWIFYGSVAPEKLDYWVNRNSRAESWFWADYTAFDATYSPEAWSLLEQLYAQIYPGAPEEFWKVLEYWRKPQGNIRLRKEDVKIKYDAPVCNASGRDDTALANALLNGLALAISIAAALAGVDVTQVTAAHLKTAQDKCAISVVGDDSVVACSFNVQPLKQRIVDNIACFGFVAKACCSPWIGDITYLGMMPYPVGDRLYMGPTIGRRLYKAFWQADPVGNLPAWTKGVARQLFQYRCVPILSDIAGRVLHLLGGMKETHFQPDPNRVWAARTMATDAWDGLTISWLCRRYPALSPCQFYSDLETVSRITRLPAIIHSHVFDACVVVDDL